MRVECYAGYRGEETPRRFSFGTQKVEILEVSDRWLSPDHRCFKVKGNDGTVYILRHAVTTREWEISICD